MSRGKPAIKKSESNAAKGSKARAIPANERDRHDRKVAKGKKTRGLRIRTQPFPIPP